MGNKLILFTARDIGAAQQIEPIAYSFRNAGFDIKLLASGVGYDYLTSAGLKPDLFEINGYSCIDTKDSKSKKNQWITKSYTLLEEIRPNAVFCGMSTVGLGIDEFILYGATTKNANIPSFQFLDSWGTFNFFEDGYPDLYFGIDRATELKGLSRCKSPVLPVGSPKHFSYSRFNILNKKQKAKSLLHVTDNEFLLGYFGQDPYAQGHLFNFKRIIDSIDKYSHQCNTTFKLILKPHPAYLELYGAYWQYLENKKIELIKDVTNIKLEDQLCACDIVMTHYSTVVLDHAYLSSYAANPIGVVLYLLAGDEIKNYIQDEFGYWRNPLLENGIGISIEKNDEFEKVFGNLVKDKNIKQEYFKNLKSKSSGDPNKKIINIVNQLISSNHN